MPSRSSWTPMARPLNPLPTMATLKPSGSSGLPSLHSAVHGNSLNAGRSRRASNSRSPISSAVAMFMRVRSSSSGGSANLTGPAFCSSQATALLIRSSRCASSRLAVVGSWASSGSPVCWYSATRTALRSATSTARRMKVESTVDSIVSALLRVRRETPTPGRLAVPSETDRGRSAWALLWGIVAKVRSGDCWCRCRHLVSGRDTQ